MLQHEAHLDTQGCFEASALLDSHCFGSSAFLCNVQSSSLCRCAGQMWLYKQLVQNHAHKLMQGTHFVFRASVLHNLHVALLAHKLASQQK
jgi:hypothetical protein